MAQSRFPAPIWTHKERRGKEWLEYRAYARTRVAKGRERPCYRIRVVLSRWSRTEFALAMVEADGTFRGSTGETAKKELKAKSWQRALAAFKQFLPAYQVMLG